ncbi:unnamed protein product, partial [Porites lobata]
MGFVVGQKIMLRRVLYLLRQDGEGPQADTANAALSASAKDLLPLFNLAEEISKLEAEFQVPQSTQENKASETATLATTSAASGSATSAASGSQAALSSPASPSTNSSPEGKPLLPSDFVFGPDGKQLKPLPLSYSQFILANIKILESLFTIKSPREAADYLTYLKFLAIKGTRFQTKAILAFDQDYKQSPLEENVLSAPFAHPTSTNFSIPPLEDCPLRFHAWDKELSDDPDRIFILRGLRFGFKLLPESDPSCIVAYESDNYSIPPPGPDFKPKMDSLFTKELALGRISMVQTKPRCVHPIGRVPKKDSGKSHPITDCSRPHGISLNDPIKRELESFRMN